MGLLVAAVAGIQAAVMVEVEKAAVAVAAAEEALGVQAVAMAAVVAQAEMGAAVAQVEQVETCPCNFLAKAHPQAGSSSIRRRSLRSVGRAALSKGAHSAGHHQNLHAWAGQASWPKRRVKLASRAREVET